VLYLAFFFPPSRGSGVYRARATANHLVGRGWDVTVATAPTRFLHDMTGSFDEALAGTVDPRVRVERPSMRYYAWERDVRRFSRFRANFPVVAQKLHRWGRRHLLPDQYASWGLTSVIRGLRRHARRRFDLVLATGNPYSSFAAAWLLNRLAGVPYVLDYRDSWTLDQFHDRPALPDDHVAWRWERRVLSRAAAVAFVNEGQREWHAQRYPEVAERMLVVLNGWDADLLEAVPAGEPRTLDETASAARPLRFTFLGTLIAGQPIEQLAEAFQLARRDPVMAGAELHLYGYLSYFHESHGSALAVRELLDEAAATAMYYHGPVPKPEVSTVYRDSDVLVFMTSGGRYVTTGKVFEYMATGQPIVSVHTTEIAARDVLQGYPLWFDPGGLDVASIAKAMAKAAHAARDLTPQQRLQAREHAATFRRDRVLDPFERRLREIAGYPDDRDESQ
jgi:glycosyltransferase involved in cell wall biosynthesis